MDKINKLSLPVTILLASIVLGGFYYLAEANKQASIERQAQAQIEEKKNEEASIESKKSLCDTQAQATAVQLNKDACDRGEYCLKGAGMYLVAQYENSYKSCLRSMGLESS